MGYKVPKRLLRLHFEDHEGLEVLCRSMTVGEFKETILLASAATTDDAAGAKTVSDLLDRFADKLESWNLEDDDGPVPATREAIDGQDADFMLEMAMAWIEAVASVDTPLPSTSNVGRLSAVPSIPMEQASESQVS